jgi:hypothetical protein
MTIRNSRARNGPISIRMAAAITGLSERSLHRAAQRGELRCYRVPGYSGRQILPEDLEAFLRPRPLPVPTAAAT